MHRRAEAFPDKPCQFRRQNGRFFLACLHHEGHDLVGELVRLLGTTLVGYQSDQAILLESYNA